MTKGRVEALADGVFAIAMTLTAFHLQPPEMAAIRSAADLQTALLNQIPNFGTYFLSFVVIGIYWIGHHFQFHYIVRVDRTLLWIGLFFLMFVAIFPFSTAVLGRFGHEYQPAVLLYSGNLLLVGLMSLLQWVYATRKHRLVPADMPSGVIGIAIARMLLAPAVAVLCAAISYINVAWAVHFYYLIVVLYVVLSRLNFLFHPVRAGSKVVT